MLQQEILEKLGMSDKEAAILQKRHGKNRLTERKKTSAVMLFLGQFKDLLVVILIISTVVSAFLGEMVEAFAILIVVFMNGMFGFLQEYRTEKTLQALKRMAAPYSRVFREGAFKRVKAEDVVPGDLIELKAGDRVPADCIAVVCEQISVDESMLTGESEAVFKEGVTRKIRGLMCFSSIVEAADHDNGKSTQKLFMGTLVVSGRAYASVHSIGMNTQMGRIASMIDDVEIGENTLQKKLNKLGKYLAVGCIIICALVSVLGIMRGEKFFDMLLSGISLAVASIPESLPAVVMVSLAVGVGRMLKKNALVKKLPAVETLGMATVICSDKTGTITENRMTLRGVYVCERDLSLEGEQSTHNQDVGMRTALSLFYRIAVLCNNVQVKIGNDGTWCEEAGGSGYGGDAVEKAMLKSAKAANVDAYSLRKYYVREMEIPFDSSQKYMAVVVGSKDGKFLMVKGAPEVVLEMCSKIQTAKGEEPFGSMQKKRVFSQNDRLAANAYRVLAFAVKSLESDSKSDKYANTKPNGLTFIALAYFLDPPRADIKDAIHKCFAAGIRPVMITGDHKNTAMAIAREAGIFRKGDEVVTGDELDTMGEIELGSKINRIAVFARVSPGHKLKIVKLLKRRGEVVAMTGDGVNDAPAVKMADIGIAMGQNGTDVTKEAASIVLLDDRFSSITDAVVEGRIIYLNIRRAVMYLLACNVGEVITMLFGILLGFPVVLIPIQILWVNLVTDGLPAIGLACDVPNRDKLISRKSYNHQNLLHDGLLRTILWRGLLMGLTTLGIFMYYLYIFSDISKARTAAFFSMIMLQLIYAVECRGLAGRLGKFLIPVALSFIFAVLVMFVEVLRNAFSVVPLGLNDYLIIGGSSLAIPLIASILRVLGDNGKKDSKG